MHTVQLPNTEKKRQKHNNLIVKLASVNEHRPYDKR